MTLDLFSDGFAWADEPSVSQVGATADATGAQPPSAPGKISNSNLFGGGVAGVAGVAETEGQRLERALSQTSVASRATPAATAETADFCGVVGDQAGAVADVATVAGWSAGLATLNDRRVPPALDQRGWAGLVRDSYNLMRLWGHDLHVAGWSVCDVFGVEQNTAHRRLDRLGLVSLLRDGEVEAIDSHTATILRGRDRMTYDRRLRAEGGVPIWAIDFEEYQPQAGQRRWEGTGGSALAALPPEAPTCQPPQGESE